MFVSEQVEEAGVALRSGEADRRAAGLETRDEGVRPLVEGAAPPPQSFPRPAGKGRLRGLIVGVVLAAAIGLAGRAGWSWWTVGRFGETTNDAYVQADITVIAAKISGYLQAVAVDNNQRVAAGDVVARIDDGDYRLALEAAENKAATQRAAVSRIDRQIAAEQAAVAQAEAQRDSAAAEVVRAAADFDRQQQLTKSDFASRAHFDEARAARDRGAAAWRSADAGAVLARANVEVLAAQRVEAQRLSLELETQVRKAERDLSFTVVRAPFDGVIGNKAVEEGSYVEPGKRMAALVRTGGARVDANFKETQLARMRPGQAVRIKVDAFPDEELVGRVVSIAPASGSVFSLLPPDNATGNFTKIVQRLPVRIALPEEAVRQGRLRPGMSVEVTVDTRAVVEP
ncbi:HlyD family secretion protein [bacterium]|nr:HlyD family secretion protein [bacterium]